MHKCTDGEMFIGGDQMSWFDGLKGWKFRTISFCPHCGTSLQPERLNPETREGCDSLNSMET